MNHYQFKVYLIFINHAYGIVLLISQGINKPGDFLLEY